MKKYFLFTVFWILMLSAFSQAKVKAKEKPPTQKELAAMMKEVQKELNNMDPAEKKMMDSMGFKLPDAKAIQKNMAGVSDARLARAFEAENRIVPKKNGAKINAALATVISNGEMNAYVNKTHQAVTRVLPAGDKTVAAALLESLDESAIANTAVGLWISGKPALALYLMGEACKSDPASGTSLNNYASFLTTCGAEQLALPILVNLNKRFPNNSSLLNNIAQAWLRTGDLSRAEKYADSAIRIYAYHPQANMAKCLIEESKGNIPAAIAAAKRAISKSYSNEKESKLKKLGYELQPDDLDWDLPVQQDMIGLGNFSWPARPVEVEQNKILQQEWKDFKNECQEKISSLSAKQQELEAATMAASTLRTQLLITEAQQGHFIQPMPGYAAKAIKKLGPGVNDVNGNMSFVFTNAMEAVTRALIAVAGYANTLDEQQKILDEKYEDQVGEGRRNPLEAICKDENAIRTEYLKNANGAIEGAYKGYLDYTKRRTGDLLYYYQFTLWPDQFELAKVNAQIAWLTTIKDQGVEFRSKSSWCIPIPVKVKPGQLQNFDDVACQYVSTMNLGIYKITSSCSNLVGEFDFGGVEINIKDNVETGMFSGSAIVGISKGFEGPMGMEAEATLAGLVEFDNTGITDWGAIARGEASAAGITIGGAEARATVNTGISGSGGSLLHGIQ